MKDGKRMHELFRIQKWTPRMRISYRWHEKAYIFKTEGHWTDELRLFNESVDEWIFN